MAEILRVEVGISPWGFQGNSGESGLGEIRRSKPEMSTIESETNEVQLDLCVTVFDGPKVQRRRGDFIDHGFRSW